MATILITIIAVISFGMLISYACITDKKTNWFNSLKVGDNILIRIHSFYCHCTRQATVTNIPEGKLITAKMDDITLEKCKVCSSMKAINNNINTCWYHVTSFSKNDVGKIVQ